jgi:NitT/TauT family transport system substrate-binding protein
MKRRTTQTPTVRKVGLGLVAVAMAAAACGGGSGGGKSGQPNVTIIQGTASLLYAPLQVAAKEGFFTNSGVNVKLVSSSSGNAAVEAAIGGSAEIVASGMSNDVLAAAQGHALNFFATMVSRLPNNIIISKKVAQQKGITANSTVQQKVQALKGLTIGITQPGSVTDQVLGWLLNRYGIDPKHDVQIVSLGGNTTSAVAGLEHGRVDALIYPAPVPEVLYNSGSAQLLINFAGQEVQPPPGYMLGLMASPKYIRDNRTAVHDVYNAVAKAEAFMHSNPTKAESDLHTFFSSVNTNVFNKAYQDSLPTVPTSPTVDTRTVTSVIDFVKSFGPVKGVTAPVLSKPL